MIETPSRITVKIWNSGSMALNYSTFLFYFSWWARKVTKEPSPAMRKTLRPSELFIREIAIHTKLSLSDRENRLFFHFSKEFLCQS